MNIAPDKKKHFYVGIIMGLVLQLFFWWLLPGKTELDTILAFIASMGISYGFELVSLITGKGVYEVMDAVAGTLGAMPGMLIVLAAQLLAAR
jgi:glycopeptide antibiotics resistance protein